MEGVVVEVVNKVAFIEGFYRPGTVLVGERGSKMLVVSRRKAFPPSYVNVLRMAVDEPLEPVAPVATARALVCVLYLQPRHKPPHDEVRRRQK